MFFSCSSVSVSLIFRPNQGPQDGEEKTFFLPCVSYLLLKVPLTQLCAGHTGYKDGHGGASWLAGTLVFISFLKHLDTQNIYVE